MTVTLEAPVAAECDVATHVAEYQVHLAGGGRDSGVLALALTELDGLQDIRRQVTGHLAQGRDYGEPWEIKWMRVLTVERYGDFVGGGYLDMQTIRGF